MPCCLGKLSGSATLWQSETTTYSANIYNFIYTCFIFSVVPRSTYSGRQLLVWYWGQNGAGPANGPANYEKPLVEVCHTTKYDILAVSFVVVFFDARNKGRK